jgi:hypothetical protein
LPRRRHEARGIDRGKGAVSEGVALSAVIPLPLVGRG